MVIWQGNLMWYKPVVHNMVSRKKVKSVPPSRLRYEATHPNVTVRVDQQLADELKSLKETTGLSMADVLKIGMDRTKPVAGDAFKKGRLSALEDCYHIACDDCQLELLYQFRL